MKTINARRKAISTIQERKPAPSTVNYLGNPLSAVFGANVFSRAAARALLPSKTYDALTRCLDFGERLDPSLTEIVANAMKDWAISRGATHFTHWFQPLTGASAEKHDSFMEHGLDSDWLLDFTGKQLVQGESDASSFPSGGIRPTCEARGYTGWDPTSPAFIAESTNGNTLYIPTIFCAYKGHALDNKTPLLRALDALNDQALRLLKALGNDRVQRVRCNVGPEQEYFLIDEAFFNMRPDLLNAGRCLFGARPPKGQEMEDHYWSTIKERVLAFMMEAESELFRLGVPVKTRHNEVAPAQFEVAAVFEFASMAADHNMLLMEVLKRTAQRHKFRCLLHEKPFSGVNGSGKHINWSLSDDTGHNLLEPGESPQENWQFLALLAAIVRAVNTWARLLRASVAFAGNDHRLGANEAPPAIMSIYLGDTLSEVVESIISGKEPAASRLGKIVELGVHALPELTRDNLDRNRTTPFAFTGNKFEFRSVGSSQAVAWPVTVWLTILVESLDFLSSRIASETKAGKSRKEAIQAAVRDTLVENQRAIFNGDNYAASWQIEAKRRGLPSDRNTVESLPVLQSPEVKELFSRYGVLSEEELLSRYNIHLEAFIKTINIEAKLTSSVATTMILPAALSYQQAVSECIAGVQKVLQKNPPETSRQEKRLRDLWDKTARLESAIELLDTLLKEMSKSHDNLLEHAKFCQLKLIPSMNELREVADELELVVDDELWPLPKFREMLFIY